MMSDDQVLKEAAEIVKVYIAAKGPTRDQVVEFLEQVHTKLKELNAR